MKSFLREVLLTLALAVVIFLLLQTTVQAYDIFGSSMEPNFHDGERLIVNKVVYYFHEPERGDVIILRLPHRPKVQNIKRIIGLPGDTITVETGKVYINGHELDEPYINEMPKYTLTEREIPEDEYFVLGDNRNNSSDSHNDWTLPRENIIGKAWLSIWPPKMWGFVDNFQYNES